MKNILFCFTGTGNSLAVARDIAVTLGDTKICLIADAIMQEDLMDLSYERVGFVCPAYFGNLPPIVGRFVAKMDFNKTQYVFAVITAGAFHGRSFDSLAGLIAERGGRLNAEFPVQMPGNNIALYGAWPVLLQRILFKKTQKRTARIVQSIKEKNSNRTRKENYKTSKPLNEKMSGYEKFAQDYHVTEKCTGCKRCAKICPMRNITMVGGRPQYSENCERCMACIQWCPVKAIEYKNKTVKRKQYRNPDVLVSDLFTNRYGSTDLVKNHE